MFYVIRGPTYCKASFELDLKIHTCSDSVMGIHVPKRQELLSLGKKCPSHLFEGSSFVISRSFIRAI